MRFIMQLINNECQASKSLQNGGAERLNYKKKEKDYNSNKGRFGC